MLAFAPAVRADRNEARKAYDAATAAFGLGHYAEAAEKYETAFSLRPDPALLYDAAQAYRLSGNLARALELYRNYARLYGNAPNASDARNHAADLERELSAPPAPGDAPPAADTVVVPADTSSPAPASPPSEGDPAPAPELTLTPPAASSSTSPVSLAVTPDGDSAAKREAPSLVRRPWFWIAIGAVAAAGVLAVVLATGGDKDPKPSLGTIVVGN